MDALNGYLNILFFIITTTLYYFVFKPVLVYEVMMDPDNYNEFQKNNYLYVLIYFLAVMIIQFIVNVFVMSSSCGGKFSQNISYAAYYTFIPWTFIFGVTILALVVFPGFKSAFSNVFGYYYVSGKANRILNDLFIDEFMKGKVDAATEGEPEKRKAMQDAADAIIKIFGNTSVLINEIVPENFLGYWNIMKPLMKDKYHDESSAETIQKRTELFALAVSRDNVGEAFWYLYTGIVLTSLVQYKITTYGCNNDAATMNQNYQQFLEKEKKQKANNDKATSVVYNVGS
jgi:hypothetical protein